MILGIGTDIVELVRVEAVLEKVRDRFARRILAPSEMDYFSELPHWRQVEFLAGRFAAKEAMGKALGLGLAALHPSSVAIVPTAQGLEVQWLSPVHPVSVKWHVSISHSQTAAIAFAVREGF